MAGEDHQKLRLGKNAGLLCQKTDEHRRISACEHCEHLMRAGITGDCRTVSEDIALLNKRDCGAVLWARGQGEFYDVADDGFSQPESNKTEDGVQSSASNTENKTTEPNGKVVSFGGGRRAESLRGDAVCFDTCALCNGSILYNTVY